MAVVQRADSMMPPQSESGDSQCVLMWNVVKAGWAMVFVLSNIKTQMAATVPTIRPTRSQHPLRHAAHPLQSHSLSQLQCRTSFSDKWDPESRTNRVLFRRYPISRMGISSQCHGRDFTTFLLTSRDAHK